MIIRTLAILICSLLAVKAAAESLLPCYQMGAAKVCYEFGGSDLDRVFLIRDQYEYSKKLIFEGRIEFVTVNTNQTEVQLPRVGPKTDNLGRSQIPNYIRPIEKTFDKWQSDYTLFGTTDHKIHLVMAGDYSPYTFDTELTAITDWNVNQHYLALENPHKRVKNLGQGSGFARDGAGEYRVLQVHQITGKAPNGYLTGRGQAFVFVERISVDRFLAIAKTAPYDLVSTMPLDHPIRDGVRQTKGGPEDYLTDAKTGNLVFPVDDSGIHQFINMERYVEMGRRKAEEIIAVRDGIKLQSAPHEDFGVANNVVNLKTINQGNETVRQKNIEGSGANIIRLNCARIIKEPLKDGEPTGN